jgi:hypothetical protein
MVAHLRPKRQRTPGLSRRFSPALPPGHLAHAREVLVP